ncbi:hypothetical protein ACHAQH_007814 [Verticillium albo-atrum]
MTEIQTEAHDAVQILLQMSKSKEDQVPTGSPQDAKDNTTAVKETAPDGDGDGDGDGDARDDAAEQPDKMTKTGKDTKASKTDKTRKTKKPCTKTESAKAKQDRITALNCEAESKCQRCAKKTNGTHKCFIDPENRYSACASCSGLKEQCSFVSARSEPLDPSKRVPQKEPTKGLKRSPPPAPKSSAKAMAMALEPSVEAPEEIEEVIAQAQADYNATLPPAEQNQKRRRRR